MIELSKPSTDNLIAELQRLHNSVSTPAQRQQFAGLVFENKAALAERLWNTNTIDTNLQRQVVYADFLEEFAVQIWPLTRFAHVFKGSPLEGTDEVAVPFYDLSSDAGNSWDPSTGYATMGNTATSYRKVAIGGSGVSSGSSAAAGTAKDRLWVGLEFSSYELSRQPYVNWEQHARLKANRLGVLVFNKIVSRVITASNFGDAAKTVAAGAFSGGDIADLAETATGLNWPVAGRSLVLDHTYATPLLKDPDFKQYLSYGTSDPIQKGRISQAYGFEDIGVVPNLSSYSPAGENLRGWIANQDAILLGLAPIAPTPEVRALMTKYEDQIRSPGASAARLWPELPSIWQCCAGQVARNHRVQLWRSPRARQFAETDHCLICWFGWPAGRASGQSPGPCLSCTGRAFLLCKTVML